MRFLLLKQEFSARQSVEVLSVGFNSNEAGQGTGPHCRSGSRSTAPAQAGLVSSFLFYIEHVFIVLQPASWDSELTQAIQLCNGTLAVWSIHRYKRRSIYYQSLSCVHANGIGECVWKFTGPIFVWHRAILLRVHPLSWLTTTLRNPNRGDLRRALNINVSFDIR